MSEHDRAEGPIASGPHPLCTCHAEHIAELEAENARLQAHVEDEKGITETAIRAMERVERERDGYKALAERRGEALEARERARLVKGEYYRQRDLGQPPSKGWEKLSFIDVTGSRLQADELAHAALTATPEDDIKTKNT